MRRIRLFAICFFVALLSGCSTNKRSTVEMTVGERHVTATTDKIATITFDNQNFVISFSAKKCIVERERVTYDGKEIAKIPAEAKSIVVEFFEGKIAVIADGQTVRAAAAP